MTARVMASVLRCGSCDGELDGTSAALQCRCGTCRIAADEHGIFVEARLATTASSEMQVRDREARGYLQHGKFPTQIASVEAWLQGVPAGGLALDLGCGPGPYTAKLRDKGCRVLAVDFSLESLRINAAACRAGGGEQADFLQADLNSLCLRPDSVDLVLMADFLQHLGGVEQRRRLLREVLAALRPGGHFYLSFFNLNIKHFLKGDVHGHFAGGKIAYERLTLPNVLADLPAAAEVTAAHPMSVFHVPGADRLASALPGARWLARMAYISGYRRN